MKGAHTMRTSAAVAVVSGLLVLSLCLLPESALAGCRWYTMTVDGKTLVCQECNGNVICN